jgi:hypothetical protein
MGVIGGYGNPYFHHPGRLQPRSTTTTTTTTKRNQMKRITLRSKAALLSSTAVVIAVGVAALTPTMAMAAGVDDLGLTPHVNGFLGVLSGPIARLVAALLVLGAVVAFWRGHDMGETVPKLGVAALGIACLIVIANVTTSIQGTGAMIPSLTNHLGTVAHHAAALRVHRINNAQNG